MATTNKPRRTAQNGPGETQAAQDVSMDPVEPGTLYAVGNPAEPSVRLPFAIHPDFTKPHLTAATSVNDHPRDPYPAPLHGARFGSTTLDIFTIGRQVDTARARRELEAMDLLREPPLVQQYRAEVLGWLDRNA